MAMVMYSFAENVEGEVKPPPPLAPVLTPMLDAAH